MAGRVADVSAAAPEEFAVEIEFEELRTGEWFESWAGSGHDDVGEVAVMLLR